jgi:hypothetical protein
MTLPSATKQFSNPRKPFHQQPIREHQRRCRYTRNNQITENPLPICIAGNDKMEDFSYDVKRAFGQCRRVTGINKETTRY